MLCEFKLGKRDDVNVDRPLRGLKDGASRAFVEGCPGRLYRQTGSGNDHQHVANLTPTFAFIKSTTKIVGIGPQDVADGNPGLVLGLLWSLIVFFASRDLGANQTKDLKKTLLDWVQKRCARRVNVEDLGASLADGRAFCVWRTRASLMNPRRRVDNLRRASTTPKIWRAPIAR